MAAVTKNRTYGKIACLWVITQKPLIISVIWHGVKMISTARSTYPQFWSKSDYPSRSYCPFFIKFLVHLDQRSRWTIAITWHPSSLKPLGQLEPNLAGMFLGWSSTELLFFVPVGYSTWLPGPIICSDWLKFQRSSSLKFSSFLNIKSRKSFYIFSGDYSSSIRGLPSVTESNEKNR
jgi:hypothetical protein